MRRVQGAAPPSPTLPHQRAIQPSSFLSPRAPGPPPATSDLSLSPLWPRLHIHSARRPAPPPPTPTPHAALANPTRIGGKGGGRPTSPLDVPPMLRCHTPPQCGRAPLRYRGRREAHPAAAVPGVVVRCARGAPQVSGIEAASPCHAAAAAARAEGGGARPSLTERLRLGSLLEDGLSYKESFIVRCYEVGINKTATVETIANLLQEVGCNHAQSVGFSTDGFATTTTMRKLGLIWVTNRMHIEIYKYPAWGDVVEIETWCQEDGRIGTRRDWILKDLANGEVIGRATSKWVMMNQNTRRLQRVSDDVRDEVFMHCPKTPRLAFPEENNGSLKKIPILSDPAQYSRLGLVPRRADLDMNQHVNNVTYIGWVLESIPQDIIDTHELQTITLDYRRECQHDDIVDSLTYIEEGEGKSMNGSASAAPHKQEQQQFLHCLRFAGNGDEINRGRTVWRKLAR